MARKGKVKDCNDLKPDDRISIIGKFYVVVKVDSVHFYVDDASIRIELRPLGVSGRKERAVLFLPSRTSVQTWK